MLSQIPPSDVVTSEHWTSLKKSLSMALGDEEDRISVSLPQNFTRDLLGREGGKLRAGTGEKIKIYIIMV